MWFPHSCHGFVLVNQNKSYLQPKTFVRYLFVDSSFLINNRTTHFEILLFFSVFYCARNTGLRFAIITSRRPSRHACSRMAVLPQEFKFSHAPTLASYSNYKFLFSPIREQIIAENIYYFCLFILCLVGVVGKRWRFDNGALLLGDYERLGGLWVSLHETVYNERVLFVA